MTINKIEIINDYNKSNTVIKEINALDASHNKGKGVKVAVIDSGIETREDFATSFKFGIDMFEKKLDVEDLYGHGTHVSGLIAGKYTGVAPESELYVAKVLNDTGVGTAQSVLDGITFAIEHQVDILCMSLGIPRTLPNMMIERIRLAHMKGITIVSATGNNGLNEAQFPANLPEVIAVGGLDNNGLIAPYSNGGYDVLAPSENIVSTYIGKTYAKMTGTSMSAPIVAGGLSLLISGFKEKGLRVTNKDIYSLIETLPNKIFDVDLLYKKGLEIF